MMTTGLVSVTFRKLAPAEVIKIAIRAGLHGIEWGGDVHVPHGDVAAARQVRKLTEDAGLRVLAYGSYFRCKPVEDFQPVLDAAIALGAPLIRVWAGDRASAQADDTWRDAVIAQSQHAVALAQQAGIAVAYEFHGNTLTDTLPSTLQLLQAVPGMKTLWQPPHDLPPPEQIAGLLAVLPWLANVHVFHWRPADRARLPLREGAALWSVRLAIAASASRDVAALLEFVRDDDVDQLLEDARTLRDLMT
jgi:sugar phosphate isomerase/epimerase